MNTGKLKNIKIKEINYKNLIKKYCPKSRCKWFARRYKHLSYIRLTRKKNRKKPDHLEFLERDKKRKNDLKKNVEIIKLPKPIMVVNDPNNQSKLIWYELNKLNKNSYKKKRNSKKNNTIHSKSWKWNSL